MAVWLEGRGESTELGVSRTGAPLPLFVQRAVANLLWASMSSLENKGFGLNAFRGSLLTPKTCVFVRPRNLSQRGSQPHALWRQQKPTLWEHPAPLLTAPMEVCLLADHRRLSLLPSPPHAQHPPDSQGI